jgi:hypothetical protein
MNLDRGCRRVLRLPATPLSTEREDEMEATTPKVVGARDGKEGFLGSIGVRFMLDGAEAG